MPFDVRLSLSRIYHRQETYARLGAEIANDVYVDLRRRGVDPVLRDGFAGFIVLTADFANREARLIKEYDDALAILSALPQ